MLLHKVRINYLNWILKMHFSKITPLILISLLTSSTLSIDFTQEKMGEEKRDSFAMNQQVPEDKFTRTWAKIQALADVRLEENKIILNLMNSDCKLGYARIYDLSLKQVDKLGNFPALQVESLKSLIQHHAKILGFIKSSKIQEYDYDLDDFLADNIRTIYDMSVSLEKIKKPNRVTYDGEVVENSNNMDLEYKDILKFLNYIINKLHPFQAGSFDYFKIYMDDFYKRENLSKAMKPEIIAGAVQEMFQAAQAKIMTIPSTLSTLVERYLLNIRIQKHIEEELCAQEKLWLSFVNVELSMPYLEPTGVHKRAKILARFYARVDVFYRKCQRPEEINKLKLQFPDEDGEKFVNIFKSEPDTSIVDKPRQGKDMPGMQSKVKNKKMRKEKIPSPHSSIESEKKDPEEKEGQLSPKDLSFKKPQDRLSAAKEPITTSPEEKLKVESQAINPQLILPSLEPKITEADRKRQRHVEKAEEQRRAREWARKVHADHLAHADLTTNRSLVADFAWMNDVINPDITMTYRSILGKLTKITTVKNDEGSRRHLIIYNTPIGHPIACYFHEPHPDEAVRIERWRLNLTEALKKAGYYQKKD